MAIYDLNPVSILGMFGGMLLGLTVVGFISRFAHAGLRNRYEQAKANGHKVMSPAMVMIIAKLFAFLILPVLGLVIFNVLAGVAALGISSNGLPGR